MGGARIVVRYLFVAAAFALVLTAVLVVALGTSPRGSLAWSLVIVAAAAPFLVSTGVSAVMDTSIDALMGRPRGSQTDRESDADLTPLGMALFVSLPLGLLGLALA